MTTNEYGSEVEVSDLGVKRISNLGVQSGRWVMDWIDQLRNYMIRVFRVNLAEPMASLMTGIVGGVKENFDEGFYQALIATGTLHVIAASGYNITMVAKVLMESLAPILGRKRALGVSLVGVVGYVILAGANPAVMRAGLMGGLVFAAQFWGREYLASWGLVITSGVMVLVAPWLITDVSFQLSVAATAGILWGEAPLRRGISKIQVPRYKKSSPTWRKIAGVLVDDLSTTLAATLATLPITAITFGRLSLISPVVNVLVLWLVPPMMAFGGVMLLLGVVSGYLAGLVGWLAWPLLALFVGVVEIFSSLPWASVDLVGLNWWIGAGWWLLLIAWWDRRGGSRR
jgi:competence protein ComEC